MMRKCVSRNIPASQATEEEEEELSLASQFSHASDPGQTPNFAFNLRIVPVNADESVLTCLSSPGSDG